MDKVRFLQLIILKDIKSKAKSNTFRKKPKSK